MQPRGTPVAHSGLDVAELAASAADLPELSARTIVCRACPQFVEWRESVATTGRRASVARAFSDGAVRTNGTAVTVILPPVSRF